MKHKLKFNFWQSLIIKSLRGYYHADQMMFRCMIMEATAGNVFTHKKPVRKTREVVQDGE